MNSGKIIQFEHKMARAVDGADTGHAEWKINTREGSASCLMKCYFGILLKGQKKEIATHLSSCNSVFHPNGHLLRPIEMYYLTTECLRRRNINIYISATVSVVKVLKLQCLRN
jgi:hypothetical protein